MAPPAEFTPTGVFPLMRLPQELRSMIIDHVISPSQDFYWELGEPWWSIPYEWGGCAGLLFASRQLSAETQDRISKRITFLVHTSTDSIWKYCPAFVKEHIDRMDSYVWVVCAIPPTHGQGAALNATDRPIHLTDWRFSAKWCSDTCCQTESLIIDASDLHITFPENLGLQKPKLLYKYVTAIAEERTRTKKLVVTRYSDVDSKAYNLYQLHAKGLHGKTKVE